jgi:hypothetical protein
MNITIVFCYIRCRVDVLTVSSVYHKATRMIALSGIAVADVAVT